MPELKIIVSLAGRAISEGSVLARDRKSVSLPTGGSRPRAMFWPVPE
jgi:hypothetical protein